MSCSIPAIQMVPPIAAYYAMFDAARSALLLCGCDVGRTHKGVLSAFSDRMVRNGPISREIGRLLKQAEAFRYVADYEGEPVSLDDARIMVQHAQVFLAAMQRATDPTAADTKAPPRPPPSNC